ncbi:hypothetical protein CEP88_12840 [Roseobacter denitrificans]|uniref:BatD protein n=1 Tax=Roseobacter denitrificans (strain ATCC 33942 / OCh 114) TaxID=375451 RepID=Q16CR4_ROSDO|nr:BatD family protein [Roseobacter denitrificans]ABG30229.1 conserved hypothetical protein [Roseobacter denitrificans OCh 114]AVL53414.1 hypothetical protein CEP88_12840 [Roseobacter denitrificans]SFF70801.1 Oxygen tolerance [Roseobacter denitrificans OCh 114]
MMQRRALFLAVLFGLWAGMALAQDPLVEVEFEENTTIPGQPLSLRVTVLVPTWLPKPVVFPTLEAPNILVQLPEGATGPASRTIDGETWSGVSRRYRVTPMVPGRVQIPAQELSVTWAEPGKPDPLQQTFTLDPIVVEGRVPEGAEDLSPFIAAQNLTLTQEVSEADMPLQAGDSVTLTLTAQIEGTSAMFLPSLMPEIDIKGVAVYPSEPTIQDKEERGKLSGTRTQSVTLVAQSGGGGAFPALELGWFNLTSQAVEIARTEGFDVTVDAPPALVQNTDPRVLAAYVAGGLAALALCLLALRRLSPRLRAMMAARRRHMEASEHWAYAKAVEAAKARDFDGLLRHLDIWAARCRVDPTAQATLQSALCALGAARYGPGGTSQNDAWKRVLTALPQVRAAALKADRKKPELPPLNPTDAQSQRTA